MTANLVWLVVAVVCMVAGELDGMYRERSRLTWDAFWKGHAVGILQGQDDAARRFEAAMNRISREAPYERVEQETAEPVPPYVEGHSLGGRNV